MNDEQQHPAGNAPITRESLAHVDGCQECRERWPFLAVNLDVIGPQAMWEAYADR